MKSILLSIRPEWVAKILNGEKTIEVRKKFPKDYVGWVYIYCTKNAPYLYYNWNCDIYGTTTLYDLEYGWSRVCSGAERLRAYQDGDVLTNGHVLARFWCDKVDKLEVEFYKNEPLYDENSCYQAVKRVCLEQLEYVDFDEDLCDRETLYTNETFEHEEKNNKFLKATCLTGKQLQNYFNGCDVGYAIHISDLEIFDKPRELKSFGKYCSLNEIIKGVISPQTIGTELTKAPQNYCYIESEE